ncbi:MAG: trehalose-phosphatase [Xanthomonadales bacterium]|nr:trehalose-phosphatase [Xanthomonadales bacterium]
MSGSEKAATDLPSALAEVDDIAAHLGDRQLAVFLDYDGTLTPIVDRPEQAELGEEMRAALSRLADLCKTAVISGRSLDDVRERVGLATVYYAGNHGLQIGGPDQAEIKHEKGREYLGVVAEACRELRSRLENIDGILIENKEFSLSVHYRLADDSVVPDVEAVIDEVVTAKPDLRKHSGKKVFEIRPRIDWDKGKAVLWLLDALELGEDQVLPLYIGDDVTDEDAFAVLEERGIGIRVMGDSGTSRARYRLRDSGEVRSFLEKLTGICEGES